MRLPIGRKTIRFVRPRRRPAVRFGRAARATFGSRIRIENASRRFDRVIQTIGSRCNDVRVLRKFVRRSLDRFSRVCGVGLRV